MKLRGWLVAFPYLIWTVILLLMAFRVLEQVAIGLIIIALVYQFVTFYFLVDSILYEKKWIWGFASYFICLHLVIFLCSLGYAGLFEVTYIESYDIEKKDESTDKTDKLHIELYASPTVYVLDTEQYNGINVTGEIHKEPYKSHFKLINQPVDKLKKVEVSVTSDNREIAKKTFDGSQFNRIEKGTFVYRDFILNFDTRVVKTITIKTHVVGVKSGKDMTYSLEETYNVDISRIFHGWMYHFPIPTV